MGLAKNQFLINCQLSLGANIWLSSSYQSYIHVPIKKHILHISPMYPILLKLSYSINWVILIFRRMDIFIKIWKHLPHIVLNKKGFLAYIFAYCDSQQLIGKNKFYLAGSIFLEGNVFLRDMLKSHLQFRWPYSLLFFFFQTLLWNPYFSCAPVHWMFETIISWKWPGSNFEMSLSHYILGYSHSDLTHLMCRFPTFSDPLP